MTAEFDAIIVGGGPAGASAAVHLAASGARVLLAERERFPREKLCGEFISPECLEHFARLGVLEEMGRGGGARVSETVFYAPSGRGVSVPSAWFGGQGGDALGLSRAEMDARLLARAREAGVRVIEDAALASRSTRRGVTARSCVAQGARWEGEGVSGATVARVSSPSRPTSKARAARRASAKSTSTRAAMAD